MGENNVPTQTAESLETAGNREALHTGPTVTLQLGSDHSAPTVEAAGLVFDCDGLLVDSESIWLDMISSWLAEHSIDPTRGTDFLGLTVGATAHGLARAAGPDAGSPEQITANLTARYSALLREGVYPMPGATEFLRAAAHYVPVAVASNGLRQDVQAMLEDVGVLHLAQAVRTVDDVPHGKPAPDLYLAAAHALQIAPERLVACEDSPTGASAARSAAMTVIGVNPEPFIELPCHYRLGSLRESTVFPTASREDGTYA